jgi:hypothetical protein
MNKKGTAGLSGPIDAPNKPSSLAFERGARLVRRVHHFFFNEL